MKLYRLQTGVIIEDADGRCYSPTASNWDELINRDDLHQHLQQLVATENSIETWDKSQIVHPVSRQEVWAAGVTYLRSRDARKEESKESGGDTFYDMVYSAERPELFFKSTAQRVVSHGGLVKIRKDSTWNVPEPELTLFINSNANIVAYTIGNDMSSRSIEGENPLYLPQAKVYDGSASIGPCLYVPQQPIASTTKMNIDISRNGVSQYHDEVAISQMKRSHQELVDYLYRELSFPDGCFLMTGTCMVPPSTFTLQSGDVITISIEQIGTLVNHVA